MSLLSDKSMRNIGGDLGRRRATANGDHKLFVVVQQKIKKQNTKKKLSSVGDFYYYINIY